MSTERLSSQILETFAAQVGGIRCAAGAVGIALIGFIDETCNADLELSFRFVLALPKASRMGDARCFREALPKGSQSVRSSDCVVFAQIRPNGFCFIFFVSLCHDSCTLGWLQAFYKAANLRGKCRQQTQTRKEIPTKVPTEGGPGWILSVRCRAFVFSRSWAKYVEHVARYRSTILAASAPGIHPPCGEVTREV